MTVSQTCLVFSIHGGVLVKYLVFTTEVNGWSHYILSRRHPQPVKSFQLFWSSRPLPRTPVLRVILVVTSLGQLYISIMLGCFHSWLIPLCNPRELLSLPGVIFLLGRPVCPPPCLSLPPSPQTQQNPGSQRSSHYSGREATLGFQHRPSRTPKPRFFLLHYVVFPRVLAQLWQTQLLPILVATISFKCILCLNSNLVESMFFCPKRIPFFMNRPVLQTEWFTSPN